MKLVFTDNKNVSKVIAESDNAMELITALEEHRKSLFVYGGTISMPGKLEPGTVYTLAKDAQKGVSYSLIND